MSPTAPKRDTLPRPGSIGAWVLAIRPKTLPAATAPVLVGASLCLRERSFLVIPAFAALFGALLLQILSNLANDYFDHVQGKDTSDRLGPVRAVQSGLLSPARARTGMVVVALGCLMVGAYLVGRTGWPLLLVGLASMLAAFAYTAGPFPLGYHGLGDVFVFLFFGFVAVVGTEFAIAESVSQDAFWASLSVGALTTNILVVNNLRDRAEDSTTGKRTLAVRFGERFSLWQAGTMLLLAYTSPVYFWVTAASPWPLALPAVTLPIAIRWFLDLQVIRGRPMNALLARAAQLLLAFSVLYSIGIGISK